MSSASERGDLIVLVADRNMRAAVSGILIRPKALGIRQVTFDVLTHPQKDPGVLRHAHSFLRPFAGKHQHAVAMFDREGCGQERVNSIELEKEVESRLARNGWPANAAALVLDPELESWVWSDSPEVDTALGWVGRTPSLRQWLAERELLRENQAKPERPKEAMEAALRLVRKPRSSAIYHRLAEGVSLRRCSDPAFIKLKTTLQRWFSAD